MFPSDGFFQNIPPLFFLPFLIVLGVFIFGIIKGLKQWNYNNHQPELTVLAKIVSKRTNVSHYNHNNGGNINSTTSTQYFVTFEVESGDRMELLVQGNDYGLLVENDQGQLTFQGSRFRGFVREN